MVDPGKSKSSEHILDAAVLSSEARLSRVPALRTPTLCVLLLLSCLFLPAQDSALGTDIDALNARESFRIGLDAYNRYAFNEAILSLEQALSYKPNEGLILDWLGKAYYRSGLEAIALREWRAAQATYQSTASEATLIRNRIEFIGRRRSFFPTMEEVSRYVETGFFPGKYDKLTIYRHPTSVLACDDGSIWAVAYGSNEIIRLDVNGVVRVRRRGPLVGFDRPYDIARGLDGRLFVSEFQGGRVSVLSETGEWLSFIGTKGSGDGQLLGPAGLAVDEAGYIYAAEFGNRRISKFDPDGAFVHSFGKRDDIFPGFLAPTGIACKDGIIYAADGAAKAIYMFDSNGAYLGILNSEGLNAPESLKIFPGGSLLVSDTRRLLLVDTDSTIVKEITPAGNSRIRYVGADVDNNGNILAANFNESEITVFSSINDVASGLFVQIERIVADRFPRVTLEISVHDANRRPIVGLDQSNFLLSEQGYPAAEQVFLGSFTAPSPVDISVLIERSDRNAAMRSDITAALRDIAAAMKESGGNITSIVSAGTQPVLEKFTIDNPATLDRAASGNASAYTPRWAFDLGARLAATDLLPRSKRRAVVFLSSGEFGGLAFEQYSLSDIAAYFANNNIKFYCVLLGGTEASEEIQYLCDETGGKALKLYRPQGIGPALKSLAHAPTAVYSFSYTSGLPTDFGRAFLPVSAEVNLLGRSGRDESGYFAPLE